MKIVKLKPWNLCTLQDSYCRIYETKYFFQVKNEICQLKYAKNKTFSSIVTSYLFFLEMQKKQFRDD